MLSGTTPVGFAWVVILAFIRITTRAGILKHPLAPEQALALVDEWLRQPYASAVAPDAHLAALALEQGAAVYSTDNDFKRFPGIEHVNPLVDRS